MSELTKLVEAASAGDLTAAQALLDADRQLASRYDASGATPLHYAALNGRCEMARLLIEYGADINARDTEFGATPAGWAIEYLRELGGHLGIELNDLAHAIDTGDVHWTERFLARFPNLREARDADGVLFGDRARASGRREIAALFGQDPGDLTARE